MAINDLHAPLDEALVTELNAFIDVVEDKQGGIIRILQKGQELFGYLPEALQLHIARKVDLPAAKINGIVSFYSFFNEKPSGKYTVNICLGTACFVKGADVIERAFRSKLKTDEENLSEDGLFTVRAVRCIGACGLAPVIMVGEKIFGHVTEQDVERILKTYRDAEVNSENPKS